MKKNVFNLLSILPIVFLTFIPSCKKETSTETKFEVTFDSDGGNSILSQSIVSGNKATKPSDPTKTGYKFVCWYVSEAIGTAFDFSKPITNSITLFALWEPITPYVIFNSNGGTNVYSVSLKYNQLLTKPSDPTKTGYTFVGWYSDVSLTTAFDFATPITTNINLYAKWSINASCSVTFNSNGGSSIASQSIVSGFKSTKPNNPILTGSTFRGWYSDVALTQVFNFNQSIIQNINLYAKWTTDNSINTAVINGRTYKTVTIGSQTWMAENLDDSSHSLGVSVCYDNNDYNCTVYGRLYDLAAAKNIDAKIAGWHLPSYIEWNKLATFLGGSSVAGDKMKVGGSSGFNALFAGNIWDGLSFSMSTIAFFWSFTDVDVDYYYIYRNDGYLYSRGYDPNYRLSVRLLKD